MKKPLKILTILALVFMSLGTIFAFGCGEAEPDSLTYALETVDDFLNNSTSYAAKLSEDDQAVVLAKSFLVKDSKVSSPSYDFSTSPLVQFSFIKKTYDKLGDSFVPGQTYKAVTTGTVNFNFDLLRKDDSPESSTTYEATTLVEITLVSDDTVTAKFGLVVYYEKDTMEERKQYIYTEISINCEKEEKGIFTFSAKTINDSTDVKKETDSVYAGYAGYSYDFIQATNGKTLSKQNYYLVSPEKIYSDETHTAEKYLSDNDFEFVVGASIYENGFISKSRNTDPREQDEFGCTQIKNALFKSVYGDFGCNEDSLSYSSFLDQALKQADDKSESLVADEKLASVYNEIANTSNPVYGILPSIDFDYGDIPYDVIGLAVMNANGVENITTTITSDSTVIGLNNSYDSHLYYIFYDSVRDRADVSALYIQATYLIDGNEQTYVDVNATDYLSEIYVNTGANSDIIRLKFTYIYKGTSISTTWDILITGDLLSIINASWPNAFIKKSLGEDLPALTSSEYSYIYIELNGYTCIYVSTGKNALISDTANDYNAIVNTYKESLKSSNFSANEDNSIFTLDFPLYTIVVEIVVATSDLYENTTDTASSENTTCKVETKNDESDTKDDTVRIPDPADDAFLIKAKRVTKN